MKKFKYWATYLVVLTMIFTSCSKDEATSDISDQEMVELKFTSVLQDYNKFQKQQLQEFIPECREMTLGDDPVPVIASSVFVVLQKLDAQGDPDGAAIQEILALDDNQNTEGLMLMPATYELQEFQVLDQNFGVLWAAPHIGGQFANLVSNPLPRPLDVVSGGKPYISQDVICYDDTQKPFYGFLFFNYDVYEFKNNFCMFVNYCEDDIDYPGYYSVSVWESDGLGKVGNEIQLIGGNMNSFDAGVPSASVLCMYLPPLSGANSTGWLFEITIMETALYDGPFANPYVTYVSQEQFDSYNLDDGPAGVHHVVIECFPGGGDPCVGEDSDGDGVADPCDICDGYSDFIDSDGDGVPDGCDVCPGSDDYLADLNGDQDGITERDECPGGDLAKCETAFMFGDTEFWDIPEIKNNRWGWTQSFDGSNIIVTKDFWAGAGKNDTTKGTDVGDVTVEVTDTKVYVSINMHPGSSLDGVHIYYEDAQPDKTNPGGFTLNDGSPYSGKVYEFDNDGDFWLIVHAGVCPLTLAPTGISQ
jgi:hypothetical protein